MGTLGVGVTPGLSHWGLAVTVIGGRVTEQVRVALSLATIDMEGEEVREIYKYKSNFNMKMMRHVGMEVPKSIETRKHVCSKAGDDGMRQ